MPEYTPPTEVIRHALAYPRERLGEPRPISNAAFDRWKAENDRQVAAKAWSEGLAAAIGNGYMARNGMIPNPYAVIVSEPSTPEPRTVEQQLLYDIFTGGESTPEQPEGENRG